MPRRILRGLRKKFNLSGRGRSYEDINPEDIFLDSANLPGFEEHAFEGRMEKPIAPSTFLFLKIFLSLVILALAYQLWSLSIKNGPLYAQISERNRLDQTLIFANRGVIYDREMRELASNSIKEEGRDFALRLYASYKGLSHVVGFVKYPSTDSRGNYYETEYRGREGVELYYNQVLSGRNGLKLRETDVLGNITSESVIDRPVDGEPLVLSIDAQVNDVLHKAIESLVRERGFVGGAGVIMDVRTGELLAMTSYPEFDQNLLTNGGDNTTISKLINDPKKPFLNRAIGGLYTPGSILKPVVALGALNERLISPDKKILSTGSISVPNPYDPEKPSVFGDWKAHGWTDMRESIAVSSDVYFYSIGGGFGDQKGLGITKLEQYFRQFRISESTGIDLTGEVVGVIPNPEWKKERFEGDIWRLGDTYITSIGQYGTLMTPLNAARMTSALANGGLVLKPSILKGGYPDPIESRLNFKPEDYRVVLEGMRDAVRYGTAVGLNTQAYSAGAKTGTAEIGSAKRFVHSWSIGFFPYENPRYAWAVIMERGPSNNAVGATAIMRQVLDWMSINAPEYF